MIWRREKDVQEKPLPETVMVCNIFCSTYEFSEVKFNSPKSKSTHFPEGGGDKELFEGLWVAVGSPSHLLSGSHEFEPHQGSRCFLDLETLPSSLITGWFQELLVSQSN